mgnify:CR=1 FL=1
MADLLYGPWQIYFKYHGKFAFSATWQNLLLYIAMATLPCLFDSITMSFIYIMIFLLKCYFHMWYMQNEDLAFHPIFAGVGLALVVIISSTALCCYWGMKRRKVRRKRAELFRKNGGLLLQQRFTAITSQGKDSSAKIFSAEELKTATNN